MADKTDAQGLNFAARNNLESCGIERKDFKTKAEHEAAMLSKLADWDIDILCLAGFMRVLSGTFIAEWGKPLLNIHPSLLPLFPGLNTHQRALDAGVKLHGCTVHHVTAGVDEGPIIAQAAVPILNGDDEDTLSARVLKLNISSMPVLCVALLRVIGKKTTKRFYFHRPSEADPFSIAPNSF